VFGCIGDALTHSACQQESLDLMNISSLLVNARPEVQQQVRDSLLLLGGVEVHAATANGQLIVTIEADSDRAAADLFSTISRQPGVLSASLVYSQFEPDPDEEV